MDLSRIIHSEKALLDAFRTRDQKLVEIPKEMQFPFEFENYHSWADPNGNYRFLVFRRLRSQTLTGLVFRRSRQGSYQSVQCLCDWCHAYGPSDQVDMLTVSPSPNHTVGAHLCVDLSCLQKIETTGNRSGKHFDRLVRDLLEKIDRFYKSAFEQESI